MLSGLKKTLKSFQRVRSDIETFQKNEMKNKTRDTTVSEKRDIK